jgi:hypothetical protein
MPTVRTSIQPHVDLEVGDAEYLDLKRQGLLIEDAETPTDTERTHTPAAAPAKFPAAAKIKE